MSSLGGLPDGANAVTETFFWPLLTVAAMLIVIGLLVATAKAVNHPVREVTSCGITGHRYRAHHTGWRCTTCGEGVLHQGELFEDVQDGAISPPRGSILHRRFVGRRDR